MFVLHRRSLAAMAVLPALFVAHAAWEWCSPPLATDVQRAPAQAPTTTGEHDGKHGSKDVTAPRERGGLFWRWTYGERRSAKMVTHTFADQSMLRLHRAPTTQQLEAHQAFRAYAREHHVFPQIPLLERRQGLRGDASWSFFPREVLQKHQWSAVDGDVLVLGDTAFVYYYPRFDGGGQLYAIDTSNGEPLWRLKLETIRTQGRFRQDARLHLVEGRLLIMSNTTSRSSTHIIDPKKGALLEERHLSTSLSRLTGLRGDVKERPHVRVRVDATEGVSYDTPSTYVRVSTKHGSVNRVAHLDPKVSSFLRTPPTAPVVEFREGGTLRWKLTPLGDHVSNVVMHDGKMFVASFSQNKPGVMLTAMDVVSGMVVWGGSLHALGSTQTEKNRVKLHIVDGELVVHGVESQGSYLEVVSSESGQTLLSKRYPTQKNRGETR